MKPLLYQRIQHPALLTSFEHNNIIKSYNITFDSQALCTICYLDYGPQMMGTPIAMVPLHVILYSHQIPKPFPAQKFGLEFGLVPAV